MASSNRVNQSELEGWDTTVLKAPTTPGDNHRKYKRHRHHRRRHRGRRIAIAVLVAVLLLVGAGVAAAVLYVNHLNSSIALDKNSADVQDVLTDVKPNEAYYVLLLGSDERANGVAAHAEGERSDVMMLVRVDPVASQVTLLSVPRDTPYQSASGEWMKINEVFNREGASASVRAVEDTVGVSISHFALIHGTGLEGLVDLLGGITVDVPAAMSFTNIAGDPVDLEPGVQRLNGAEALGVANTRMVYADNQDMHRQEAARLVVQGILDEVRTTPVTELPSVVNAAAECVSTDMSVSDILDMLQKLGAGARVYSGSGPSAGCIDPWVSDLWLCYVDPAGWERVLGTVDAGGDPSTVSYVGDVVTLANAPAEADPVVVGTAEEAEAVGKAAEAAARDLMARFQELQEVEAASAETPPDASEYVGETYVDYTLQ